MPSYQEHNKKGYTSPTIPIPLTLILELKLGQNKGTNRRNQITKSKLSEFPLSKEDQILVIWVQTELNFCLL